MRELRSRPVARATQGTPKGRRSRVLFSLVTFFWASKRKLPAAGLPPANRWLQDQDYLPFDRLRANGGLPWFIAVQGERWLCHNFKHLADNAAARLIRPTKSGMQTTGFADRPYNHAIIRQ